MAAFGLPKADAPVRSVNAVMRGVSVGIPLFLAATVGYILYLVAKHILWQQFMHQDHRPGLAFGFVVPFALVAALMIASYLRIFITARTDPAAVPLGPEHARYYHGQRPRRGRSLNRHTSARRPQLCGFRSGAAGAGDPESSPVDLETGLASIGVLSGPGTDGARRSPALPPARPPDPRLDPDSPGLELFYTKDVFECSVDGRPIWCNECGTWKPDRAHHSSELNRCIRKLDHYCPWVGGVVAETTFKFFLQFNVYALVLCAMTVGISAYAFVRHRQLGLHNDPRVVVALALSATLGLFAGSMAFTCLSLALTNQTSVEAHQRRDRNRPRQLAVRIQRGAPAVPGRYNVVTYPLPREGDKGEDSQPRAVTGLIYRHRPAADDEIRQSRTDSETPLRDFLDASSPDDHPGHPDDDGHGSGSDGGSEAYRTAQAAARAAQRAAQAATRDRLAYRTFAIVPLRRGMNVWNLGWRQNWVSVMGKSPLDWLLPLHGSPCCTTDPELLAQHCFYRMSAEVAQLCAQYNLPPAE